MATSCVPWEKFRRAMHIPFSISLCKVSTEALAGPVDVCVREGDQYRYNVRMSNILCNVLIFRQRTIPRCYLHSLPILLPMAT